MPLAAFAAAGLTVSSALSGLAALTLDAHVTDLGANDPTVSSFATMAQTFKVQHAGKLAEVDLHYGNQWFASGQRFEVWSVSGGKPLSPLSSVSSSKVYPFTADWHAYPLTTQLDVKVGDVYALVARSNSAGGIRWSYNERAAYTDGAMFVMFGVSWSALGLGAGSAFVFRTFVDAPTAGGAGLQIGYDLQAGATATEGVAPTMTGTYSGNTGTVELSADAGKVSPGPAAGTWKWTGDIYDEDNAPASVTVTVKDTANGNTMSTTFALKITAVQPTVTIAVSGNQLAAATTTSGPSVPEGTTLTLAATGHSANPTDQQAGFTYSWSVTRDGVVISSASGGSYTLMAMDEATYVVTVTAKDDGGQLSDPASVTVVATEVQPTAIITSIRAADPAVTFVTTGETLYFSGSFNDPAPEAHTFHWDFGDGTSSTSLFTSHAYSTPNTYTVTLTVADDEGVANSVTATVKVLSLHDALNEMVKKVNGIGSLNAGQQNSLIAKLNAASDSAARGNNQAAHNQLNAFVNELNADLQTGKVSADAYDALRADAHAVEISLGTFNRFLGWWPLPA